MHKYPHPLIPTNLCFVIYVNQSDILVQFFRQPSPVDKLLFLPNRLTSKTSDAAMLISSEAGYLHWWALFGAKHEVGKSQPLLTIDK